MIKIIVFASGNKDGGGSGFQELVENSRTGILKAKIAAVVSNHKNGGVKKRAKKLKIPFYHFSDSDDYQKIIKKYKADFICLSGWLKLVRCLDPKTTINIHPAPLPKFGGKGLYGHYVHQAVIRAFKKGKVKSSAVSMHFVTEKYDEGPVFFRYPILIRKNDTAEILAQRVNKIEHAWQSYITNLVVHRRIYWDGISGDSHHMNF